MKVGKKIGVLMIIGAIVFTGGVFTIGADQTEVLAQATKINQQQEQLAQQATTKVVAIAKAQAQAQAEAEAAAKAEAEAKAKAEVEAAAKAQAEAKAKAEAEAAAAQAEATTQTDATTQTQSQAVDGSATNSTESSTTPATGTQEQTQTQTQPESNQAVAVPTQPALSFADAGRAIVNQGCSGFFISPTQVVTASHCALSTSSVQLAATGETFGATISQNVPGKDFAILTVDHPNNQASSLWKRSASAGESVTVYSRLSGTFTATIVTQEAGTVTVNGNGTTQLNFGDSSLGSTINAINAPVSVGDSGSIVIGSDGAYLGVIAASDLSTTSYFVS
ncbi:MAG: trypsin-like peptidase domain-containing protein [Culicoidibacterales bacterium]